MNFFINKRLKKANSQKITTTDILSSKSIIFAVFSRYGDGIISFQIIREFIEKYPKKRYLLLTTRQHFPYAKEILPDNVIIKKVNKRNPIDLFIVSRYTEKFQADLGFNPWSHGNESKYFISFAKKYYFYKDFDKFDKIFNLYDRIRLYLYLPINEKKKITKLDINGVKSIVFAPFSTDNTKNLSLKNINEIFNLFENCNIILALPKNKNIKIGKKVTKFFFSKRNSGKFLEHMKQCELFVGVDAGPLHLAIALKKPFIAIFGPTNPDTILNNTQEAIIIRDKKLKNSFCFFKNCNNPICINQTNIKDNLSKDYTITNKIQLVLDHCPLKD